MARIHHFTEEQARKLVTSYGKDWDDASDLIRYCGRCDSWVYTDDYSGTFDSCIECLTDDELMRLLEE